MFNLIFNSIVYLIHHYLLFLFKTVFDYKAEKDDIFGCLADIGWITGHSYVVYGPLCNGGTTVLFESSPIHPDAGRYWETVERLKITQIYIAPTSIRLLIKYGSEWVTKYDRSSLKVLGSVGEPINSEAWIWYYETVGDKKCKIADTWWQTETGGHCITPLPSNQTDELKPCKAMRAFLGIQACLVDDEGKELDNKNSTGKLCIKKPWPGMARTIYGDHARFLETYLKPFPGFYFTGDGAELDSDGHFRITGRVDDVINVSGHRIGTAEIENALVYIF
jgi:acetyl-CoA synthetase